MNLNDKQLDILDKFLRGELSEEETVLWKEMLLDSTVQDEIRNLTHLQQAITKDGREALRMEMEEWDQQDDLPQLSEGKRVFLRRNLLVAASIAVLLMAVGWFLFQPDDAKSDFYADNFQPYPNVIAPLQKGGQEVSDYEKAFQFYESGEYESAIKQFERLPQTDEAVQFYRALTWISLGQNKLAEKELAVVVSKSDHRFLAPAQWYLALTVLKSGDIELARVLMKRIAADTEHPFHSKARKFLQLE